MKVRAGDVVGLHYDNSNSPGIVPYADSNDNCAAFGLAKRLDIVTSKNDTYIHMIILNTERIKQNSSQNE